MVGVRESYMEKGDTMVYEKKNPDFELSPYTGMTRKHWMEAGQYLLEGIFGHITDHTQPVVMPRQETKITYPHADATGRQLLIEQRAEIFEGLTRSFFIASVLIKNEPEMEVCGISLREYYKQHILRVCTRQDQEYIGDYEEMQKLTNSSDVYRCYQQTVESCALVIGLDICRQQIWQTYSQEEKDRIADLISSFAHASTVPQNWRFFNMLDLAFLHKEGYEIDREIMVDHAQAVWNYTVGDGWYRDGQSFDYYSCWAFNTYAPIWNEWYGYENEPYLAIRFEESSNKLMQTYPAFFDRDGFTNMWGRSGIYRNAATSPLVSNFFLKNPAADPGQARRIVSGSLLQFLERDDFLKDGIPTLGFYGQFTPLVQGYSCAESPFWLGKAFLCLELPEDHPFWTARENNGIWDRLEKEEISETILNGPALCFTNHQANGEVILRSAKVYKTADDIHGMWNYGKLNYNAKYPWEATPGLQETGRRGDDLSLAVCEAQQYLLFEQQKEQPVRGNVTLWCGKRDGVLYRRQFFGADLSVEQHWLQAINLADFPVERGILRVDKLRLIKKPVRITLGAYGFPENQDENGQKTQIIKKRETLPDGSVANAIILIGQDHLGRGRQMAMTCYAGWEQMEVVSSRGTNPDSEHSLVVYGIMESRKMYGGAESYLLISQVITAEVTDASVQGCVFSNEELFPIQKIEVEDTYQTGAYGPITLYLKNNTTRIINYEEMEAAF